MGERPSPPAAPPAWLLRLREGYALLQQGRPELAERVGRGVLAERPREPAALELVAIALNARCAYADATRLFAELTRAQPEERRHWTNLGTAARANGDLEQSLAAYAQAARLGEESADFRYNLGLLHLDRGDFDSARAALAQAHRLAPLDVEIAYQYGIACYESTRAHEGAAALTDWRKLHGLTTELIAKFAILWMNLGEPGRAEEALTLARRDPRPGASARLQIAVALERTNRLDEARTELDALLELPEAERADVDVRGANAKLAQREGRHELAVREYRALADGCADEARKHYYLFPLAKSLDALGQYAAAFDVLEHAHRSQQLFLEATAPDVVRRKREPMRITRHGCDARDVAQWNDAGAPSRDESPIFIVAYPRSGTTLLEHTLDAHPGLRSMDEQPFIQSALEQFAAPGVQYPERLAPLSAEQVEHARSHYWKLVASRVTLGPGQRLLDKNPLNILRLPAIRRLFPHSPIVLAIRHPCDVLLSCYMQHFRAEFAWLCRDLETLAVAYRRSFDFWYEQALLLEPAVLEVRYERFVSDFDAHVRALAGFLGLPWHDAMLSPGERALERGFISTPSYSQVVEPVHSRSVDRWQSYAAYFALALPHVEPYLRRWGYSAGGTAGAQNSR